MVKNVALIYLTYSNFPNSTFQRIKTIAKTFKFRASALSGKNA